jgi:hypothetical protein
LTLTSKILNYRIRSCHPRTDGTIIPIGTPCKVTFSAEKYAWMLSFDDGEVVELDKNKWHLAGIDGPHQSHMDAVYAIEDQNFLDHLEKMTHISGVMDS